METGSLLLSKLSNTVWAIRPEMLPIFENVLNMKFNEMEKLSAAVVAKKPQDEIRSDLVTIYGSKAIISVSGILMDNCSWLDAMCGMTSYGMIEQAVDECANASGIDHIITLWDSPGGMASGCNRATNVFRAARDKKRCTSLVTGQCCSAAYYLASGSDEVYADDPIRMVGHIGCYMLHVDQSKKDEKDGYKFTYIKAGEFKTDGNSHEPLSKSAMEQLQESVNTCYENFINDVAINRRLSVDQIRGVANGKWYDAVKAPKEILDGFATLGEILTW